MGELELLKRYLLLYSILILLMIPFSSATLNVTDFFPIGLDSDTVNTGIIGNNYTLQVIVKNNFNYTYDFLSSDINFSSNDSEDTLVLRKVLVGGSCTNCSLVINDTAFMEFDWTASTIRGARTFSLNIGNDQASFGDSGNVDVNSIMDEVVQLYDGIDVVLSGNSLEVNVTGIDFTDTVFEYVYIQYGTLDSLYNWANLWLDFNLTGHVNAGNLSIIMDSFTLDHPTNMDTFIDEYCKQNIASLGYVESDCVAPNNAFSNLTKINDIIELARSTARFRVVNWTFSGNLTKATDSLYGRSVYGDTSDDMISKMGAVLTEIVPTTPLPVLTFLDFVDFRDVTLEVQNTTAGSSVFDGNGISSVPNNYTVYINYTDQYGNKGQLPFNVTVLTTAPTIPTSLSLTSTIVIGDTLTATASGSTDYQENSLTYYYEFYNVNDSTTVQAYSTTNSYVIQVSDAHDTISVRAKAYDGAEYSTEKIDTKVVSNTASVAPTVLVTTPAYAENDLFCNITVSSSDIDGDTITYSYAWTKDAVAQGGLTTNTVSSSLTRVSQNWTCTVTPNDGTTDGASSLHSVLIVLGANTQPNITGVISDITTPEDTDTSVNISSLRYDLEEELDDLNWNLLGTNESLFFATIANNVLSINPVTYGFATITIRLLDSGGLFDSQQINVNITNVNEAPIFTSTPTTSATEDLDYTYQLTSVDVDGDALTYSFSVNPAGMTINSSSGLISWTPDNSDAGTIYNVIAIVDDGTVTDEQNFSIYVTAVNDAPTISGVSDQSGTEDTSFTLNVSTKVSDVDNTNSLLTISTNSSYASVTGQVVTFEYPDGVTSESVKITVSDGQLSVSDTITVTITAVNDAPSTPSVDVMPKTVVVSDTLTCSITVPSEDIDNSSIYYNYTWYKDGAFQESTESTSTTNILSATASGTNVYECNVTATDGQYTTDMVSDSVKVGNAAPTTPAVDVTPNVAYATSALNCSITTNSTDANGDTITYNYKWYKKSASESQFYLQSITDAVLGSGNTTKGDSWKCEVKAGDGSSFSQADSDTVSILNSKPQITAFVPSTSTTSTTETTNKEFNVTLNDGDGESLTTTWYKDNTVVGTGVSYTYVPTSTSAGTYAIKVIVSDGESTDETSWTLTVTDVNNAPVIDTIGAQSCNERDTCPIYVSANDDDADNSLTYYDNSTLFTIDGDSGAISFSVPDLSADETRSIRITVIDDKGGYDSEIFSLSLKNVNRQPVLNPIGTLSAVENVTFSKQLSATDADSDSLTYSNSPTTLFSVSSSGLISFTPNQTHVNVENYTTNISVSDGNGGVDTEEVLIVVKNTNNAPSFVSSPSETTASLNEAQSQYFNINATDADGTTPNIRWYLDGTLTSQIDNYNYTTTYTSAGTHTVLVIVDDGLVEVNKTWTVTVSNVNRAPSITAILPVQQAVEDQAFTYTVSATDADSDTLVYSTNTSLFTIGVLTGAISFTPTQSNVGLHSIRLFVADGTVRVNTTFTLNISNVNDEPVLSSIGALTAIESAAFSTQLSATDGDSDALTYSDDTGLFDISSSGLISFTPTFQDSGTYPVRITVSDGNGGTDYEDITVTVLQTNQAPNITSYNPNVASTSILEDNSSIFNATATDPDGTTPGIKWYLDNALVGTGSSYTFEGDFSFDGSNAGTYTVIAVATDGLLNDTNSWTLTVNRTRDSDEDLIPNYRDNCELVYNPDQTYLDGGTPEGLLCENNVDGDDVLDDEDFIEGGTDNLDTNVDNIELKIEDSSDLNRVINETQPVELTYKEYDLETGQATEKPLINFTFEFTASSKLDLGNLSVKTQDEDETTGAIIVSGLDLSGQGKTKTLFIDDLDNTKNSVCIKDADIAVITEISGTCNGDNETKLACNSAGHSKTFQGRTYTCTDLGTTLKIEGLVHSGIRQDSCTSSWSCSAWSTCVGGTQSCSDSWTDANNCGPSYSGLNTQSCTVSSGGTYDGIEKDVPLVKTGVWVYVYVGETKSLNIYSMAVNLIEFSLLEEANNVMIIVEQIETPSVSKAGKVYNYFEISKENFENSQVDSAKVSFKVEKSWLIDNQISSEGVVLFRYNSGWNELTTAFDREDELNYYYSASTPGFSMFAIGSKIVSQEEIEAYEEAQKVTEEEITEEASVEEIEEEEIFIPTEIEVVTEPTVPSEQESIFKVVAWIIVIVAIAAIIVVNIFFGRGPKTAVENYLRKAHNSKVKATEHKSKADEYESLGKKSSAIRHLRKANFHESKMDSYRTQAEQYHTMTNLKKAAEIHKKGELLYNAGHYEKSKKYYKLAQKYRERANKKTF